MRVDDANRDAHPPASRSIRSVHPDVETHVRRPLPESLTRRKNHRREAPVKTEEEGDIISGRKGFGQIFILFHNARVHTC